TGRPARGVRTLAGDGAAGGGARRRRAGGRPCRRRPAGGPALGTGATARRPLPAAGHEDGEAAAGLPGRRARAAERPCVATTGGLRGGDRLGRRSTLRRALQGYGGDAA